IARSLPKTCPNTSSHSSGCTVRVSSSVWSCRSFCSSTRLSAPVRDASVRTEPRASAQLARGGATATDISQALLLRPGEVGAGVVAEDVLEGGADAEVRLEPRGRADRGQAAAVHQRDRVAQL